MTFSQLLFSVGIVTLVLPAPADAQRVAALDRGLAAARGRLVVKYRQLDSCMHCLVEHGARLATETGSDGLDVLHRELGVRGARALFFTHHGGGRRAAYREAMERVRGRFAQRAGRAHSGPPVPDLSGVYVLELSDDRDVAAAAARYAADPHVEYAHPDYEMQAVLTPDDPYYASSGTWSQPYPDLWGLHAIDAATAWDTANGTGTVIAVIDTGIDHLHPDLAANMWTNPGEIAGNGVDDDGNGFVDDTRGWDFDDDDDTPYDEHGHGTHVAGTAAAVGQNGIGVVGVGFGARVMAVKGLNADGIGLSSNLAEAIVYAAENGADVLNNSWGGFVPNAYLGIPDAMSDAVAVADALGVVVVAAAGNSNGLVDMFEPAGIPQVIAVGASDHADQRAGFSNFGPRLSIAAPGVDVLSLRSDKSPVSEHGEPLGSDYLRLNGTSMASPHAAGLAAVLLSAQPGLTPNEVRWRLELNADQPGYPGYESEPWNPYFGWGRIDAGRVFDLPPVTTRLHAGPLDFHAFVGTQLPDVGTVDFSFTTENPVAWTATSPSWLVPSTTAGSGAAALDLDLDTSALAVGGHAGAIAVSAPDAVDGGASVPATVEVHRDERVGGPILVDTAYRDDVAPPTPPRIASDGDGALLAWGGLGARSLFVARVDDTGVSGPYVLATNEEFKEQIELAFDGTNYLAVWMESDQTSVNPYRAVKSVRALRLTPAGTPLDATPIVVHSFKSNGSIGLFPIGVGFDGSAYTIMWTERHLSKPRAKIRVRRLGTDGSLAKARKIAPGRQTKVGKSTPLGAMIACNPGSCLLLWEVGRASALPNYGTDRIYGVRLVGDKILDQAPIPILDGSDLLTAVRGNGADYLVVADRFAFCPETGICSHDVVATRVGGNGASLDREGILLNSSERGAYPRSSGLTWDGTNWVATFIGGGNGGDSHVFAARLAPDGTVLDGEPGGLLVHTAPPAPSQTLRSTIAATATDCIVTWANTIWADPTNPSTITNPIYAQRFLAHPGP